MVAPEGDPRPAATMRSWHAVEVTLSPPAREAVEYALIEAGALGTQSIEAGDDGEPLIRVTAYFGRRPELPHIRAALAEALRIYSLSASSVREIQTSEVAARDWLAEWKQNWRPVEAGERFLIAPPWSEIVSGGAPERIVIRIEPGMAFGTGTHETTRLCLAAIEKHFRGGSFLDVGTGTGILAIAAAKLHPAARIEACDTDPEAIGIARTNAHLNTVGERIGFRVGTVDETTRSADCVCANLTADVIVPRLLPALRAASCRRLILSGILDTQIPLLRSCLDDLGIGDYEIMTEGEWVAFII